MQDSKWIPGLQPTTAVADAARRALDLRLGVLHHYLPLAVKHADEDLEHVHQLRVGTRRARAALDIFAACLPAKALKKVRKQLKRLRRAAGEARDWDVFLITLRDRARRHSATH